MIKHEFSTIGSFHTNHNEDFLISTEIGNNQWMIAVMDGCTMGTESYFASTLIGKLLKKRSKELYYKAFIEKTEKDLVQILKETLQYLFEKLQDLKNQLALERDELLSTIILGIIDLKSKSAELITIGDGLIACNDHLTEYEQNNKPDYIGYHLHKSFEIWYEEPKQRLTLHQISDLSIASDGIFTFRKFDTADYEKIEDTTLIAYLLHDQTGCEHENMLLKKILEIEKRYGLKPTDDLTMIRLIF